MAAVIAGGIVGVVLLWGVLILLVLYQSKQKHRRADNNVNGDAVPTPTAVPDPVVTSRLLSSPPPTRTIPIDSTIKSLSSIVPISTVKPPPIQTPVLASPPPSAQTVSTVQSNLQRTLTQSSRSAYEEEIERLRQEVLAQKSHITFMHEQMEFTNIGSPPPSYRSSRRSDRSGYSDTSSTLPPLPPRRLPSPYLVLDGA
ncbi:hypothetical protein EDD18DRAFT_1183930 [Armillaria luteobubalina]|uniref:Uncharacterized protein n=1 Tax=Armillaria luteobubalina TaxID=153913 RepID=A0AA39PXC5_9AGAR|nr:hypothetical protein EDD18DRAFT_1183930 [Armillaria luteobubalina]